MGPAQYTKPHTQLHRSKKSMPNYISLILPSIVNLSHGTTCSWHAAAKEYSLSPAKNFVTYGCRLFFSLPSLDNPRPSQSLKRYPVFPVHFHSNLKLGEWFLHFAFILFPDSLWDKMGTEVIVMVILFVYSGMWV